MQVCMMSQRVLLLLEPGHDKRLAVTDRVDVLGFMSAPTAARVRQLQFEQRSRKRVGFRRNWWRRLTLLLLAGLALASWAAHGSLFFSMIEGMNLKLPFSTRFLLDPSIFTAIMLGLVFTYPSRRHEEDLLEFEARICWRLKTLLAQKVPYPEAMAELSLGRSFPWGLAEVLDAAWCQERVSQVADLWAQQVEWRLESSHLARQNRAILLLFVLSGGLSYVLFSAVTWPWCCPLVGNLG